MKTRRSNAHLCTRRHFLRVGAGAALVLVPVNRKAALMAGAGDPETPLVSIAKVRNGDIPAAVAEAIDLLGGIAAVTAGKQRILLKPNLVGEGAAYTTKPAVVGTLARLMLEAGKDVLIGEGSAGATGFNWLPNNAYITRCPDLLERLQQYVFDQLGYSALAKSLGVPLLNLHLGDLVTVPVPQGLFWREITLPRVLTEVEYTADDKAYLTWTNQVAGPPAYVVRSSRVDSTSWGRWPQAGPGRAEFDMNRAPSQFFQVRKMD